LERGWIRVRVPDDEITVECDSSEPINHSKFFVARLFCTATIVVANANKTKNQSETLPQVKTLMSEPHFRFPGL
jgi:hypothetical protein